MKIGEWMAYYRLPARDRYDSEEALSRHDEDALLLGLNALDDHHVKLLDRLGIGIEFFIRVFENPYLGKDLWAGFTEHYMRYANANSGGSYRNFQKWKKASGLWRNGDVLILMTMPSVVDYPASDIRAFKSVNKSVDDIIRYIGLDYDLAIAAQAHNKGVDPMLMNIIAG